MHTQKRPTKSTNELIGFNSIYIRFVPSECTLKMITALIYP